MQQILSSGSWMHDLSEFAMARCWPWARPGLPQTHQTPPLACSPASTAQPTSQPKTQGHRQGWCFGPGPASGSLSQTFSNQPPGDGTALKTPAQQQQRRHGCPHLRRDSCPTCLRSGAAVRSCLQLDERQYGQASTFVAPAPARCHTLLERATEKGHRHRQRAILVCCHSQRPHHFSWLLPRKVLLGMFVCTFCALTKHLGCAPRYHAGSCPDRKSPGIACPEALVRSRPRHQGLDADSYVSILAMP